MSDDTTVPTTQSGAANAAPGVENITTDDATEAAEGTDDDTAADGDTFSRAYVEKLRDDVAKYRVRAQRTTELEHRLHRALVEGTGKLADPADLEFAPEHLDDPDALTSAINALLTERPHLRSRTPRGDVGQGSRGSAQSPVNLLGILKGVV